MELRPYYDPNTFRSPSGPNRVLSYSSTVEGAGNGSGERALVTTSQDSSRGYDYLDLDLGDSLGGVCFSLLRLYGRIFISQPWEVCRLLLQVGEFGNEDTQPSKGASLSDELDGASDSDEEVDYFTTNTEDQWKSEVHRQRNQDSGERQVAQSPKRQRPSSGNGPSSADLLEAASMSFVDMASALNDKDGFRGLWRGLNTSFVLDALSSTIEAWLSGFFSSVAQVPDPHFVPVLGSPSPLVSLASAVLATVGAAAILSPLDVLRTRLIVMSFEKGPRSIRSLLRRLDRYTSPASVLLPTVLHAGIPAIISKGTPYYLYTRLRVDSYGSPSLYSLLTLVSATVELVVKLPLETIMRRAQLASLNLKNEDLIVTPIEYDSIVSTIWDVLFGKRGIESLYRGWRVSLMGTLGDWGVRAMQGAQTDSGGERF